MVVPARAWFFLVIPVGVACSGAPEPAKAPPAVTVATATPRAEEPVSVPPATQGGVAVWQAGTAVTPVADGALHLRREPFRLRFALDHYDEGTGRLHAARLLVVPGGLAPPIALGPLGDEHPFGPGRGFAAEHGGYSTWQVDDGGFHYITAHPTRPELSRCQTVRALTADRSEVEVEIRHLQVATTGRDYSIERLPLDAITIVAFFDRNLNEAVDDGELTTLLLSFGPLPQVGSNRLES